MSSLAAGGWRGRAVSADVPATETGGGLEKSAVREVSGGGLEMSVVTVREVITQWRRVREVSD